MTRRNRKFFPFLFLLYFISCAVSPLSAVAPFEEAQREAELEGGEIDLFVVDLALWKILKKGKPSDDSARITGALKTEGSKNFHETAKRGVMDRASVLMPPFPEAVSRQTTTRLSFHIQTPLLYSGLSPPLF
jgi:hypothetical protein